MNHDQLRCGLDFGTSNTAIAITDTVSHKNILMESDCSVLHFADTNDNVYTVGKEAISEYINSSMSGRLLKSVKTLLKQNNFTHTHIFGKKFTPDELVTLIIKNFKQRAENKLGHEINQVVLGRPVIFSEDPEKERTAVTRLLKAATNAGFSDIKLLYEPIAAAFSYEVTLTRPERVLVADFGGGTSDFTIMNLGPDRLNLDDRKPDIIANGGIYIGGDLFDSQTMWHKLTPLLGRGAKYSSYNKEVDVPTAIHHELRKWERSFLLKDTKLRRDINSYFLFSGRDKGLENLMALIDNNLVYALFQQIEKSKIRLSSEEETKIEFVKESINIHETMSLGEFRSFIKSETDKIEQYVLSLMDTANLKAEDIDTVFLTGGSASVVPIKNIFERIFGNNKIRTGDNFNSIAYGLSLSKF
jgi:hypothetical chaperone protein